MNQGCSSRDADDYAITFQQSYSSMAVELSPELPAEYFLSDATR